MQGQYSLRSPAVKRLMKEAQELREPTAQFHAQPLEDNLFEWHFTIRGPDDTEFSSGIYHGRIILPPEYPMKPPSIIILTPNGRFEINSKICLSISGHHPESWQPSWSIRTAMLAIIGFMPTHGGGAIGSLDYSPEERKRLAKKSQDYKCPNCGTINAILKPVSETSQAETEEAKELASQINFQAEKKVVLSAAASSPKTSESEGATGNTSVPSTPSTPSTPQSPTQGSNVSPPWQAPWQSPPGMPRFPFMPPFMRPGMMMPPSTTSSGGTAPGNNPAAFAAMNMAAMQAAWQQMRFPQAGMTNPGFPGSSPVSSAAIATASSSSKSAATTVASASTSSSAASASAAETKAETTTSDKTVTTTSSTTTSSSSSASTSTTTSTAPTTSTTTPEGARQRVATARVNTSTRSAELPRRAANAAPPQPRRNQSRTTNMCYTVVMTILAVALVLLLLRRLSIMGVIQFEQDEL